MSRFTSPALYFTEADAQLGPILAFLSTGTHLITNGPQVNPGDVSPSWSPQRNVAESEQYGAVHVSPTAAAIRLADRNAQNASLTLAFAQPGDTLL